MWWLGSCEVHDVVMVELPTGTVTMLFSDIEGSTALLSRLGAAYADALDGQRQVLRKAWAEHGGIELGTEGDSFFVVFSTAEGAVAAAAQAQRDLASFGWPGAESVRVRMGIHTGTPQVHGDGYVGMDVHRAARIAGAAHGGQVVVSSATAELVAGCLPDRVVLRHLGSHQLKDIAQVEHLFQLSIEGLPHEFPALRTLGAASRLPRPATPLVGRDGELAQVTAVLSSPDVRLLTLTGPGGSGKTRLAIAVAGRVTERFPDGVFFVSLATAATSEVMWTTIAEAVDIPPERRTPAAVAAHMSSRTALLVLDNLEQVPTADEVVAALLDVAPKVVVVATSRRPLHVAGEHEHPVPPLQLPSGDDLSDPDELSRWGAVGMFVQYAQMVRPGFALTARNAADVVQVCRRLDGLPLAVELAAARTKLLSPAALLTRLDSALDLAAAGRHVPDRQKTLRDTIAWSYRQLTPDQQLFFRRLGVFAGGGSLDAITAVTADIVDADPFDLVADLADASLVTITDDEDGEPRVGMLETIRAFARDQLRQAGEYDEVARNHAEHYLTVVRPLGNQLLFGATDEVLQARRRFESEDDNVREALTWAMGLPGSPPPPADQVRVGCELCADVAMLWMRSGYVTEARRRLERAISVAGDGDNQAVARCLTELAAVALHQSDAERARAAATQAATMCHQLGNRRGESSALIWAGWAELELGHPDSARRALESAIHLARDSDDSEALADALSRMALVEAASGNPERSLECDAMALRLHQDRGNARGVLNQRHNMACTLREMGRLHEAHRQMGELIPEVLRLADPNLLVVVAEDYAAVLAELGHHIAATRLLASVDAMRERSGSPRLPSQQRLIAEPFAESRAALDAQTWAKEYRLGRDTTVEEALPKALVASGG
jgi:predicted ATPase/class 3 adenylate cyclase